MKPWTVLLTGMLLSFGALANPIWVGPDCEISWEPNPPAEMVQGYNIHIRNTGGPMVVIDASVGNATSTTCSAQGLTQGRYEAWVTAYNPVGESGPSNVVPFVLVTSAPDSPGGVTAPTGMSIKSVGVTQ